MPGDVLSTPGEDEPGNTQWLCRVSFDQSLPTPEDLLESSELSPESLYIAEHTGAPRDLTEVLRRLFLMG